MGEHLEGSKKVPRRFLGLLYSYFGRSLTGSSGIGLGQLFVLLLCIWVPVILFFLVSFSLTFTLWVLVVGLCRGLGSLRIAPELGLPQLLAADRGQNLLGPFLEPARPAAAARRPL